MAFKVYRDGRQYYGEYGDDDNFKILEGGALEITRANGDKHYLSARMWETIDETPAPSAYETQGPLVLGGDDGDDFDPMTAKF